MIKALIYNSDIAEIKKKMQKQNLNQHEIEILKHDKLKEWQVQSAFRRLCLTLKKEIEYKNLGKVEFRQNDNGGKLSGAGKIRKFREGTVAGMLDITIYAWSRKKNINKTWLIEVKRVGSPAQIKISKEQLEQIDLFKTMTYSTHLANNTIYFKEVICKEIMDFIN